MSPGSRPHPPRARPRPRWRDLPAHLGHSAADRGRRADDSRRAPAPLGRAALRHAVVLLAALLALPGEAAGQGWAGPRSLFPELPPPQAEQPAPEQPAPVETPPVEVAPLAPPGLGARGLPRAEQALGGPLWPGPAPPALAASLARLPSRIDDPTLSRLQRDLLLAPGPASGAGADAVRSRVERLLAMGEAPAAAELMTMLPPSAQADTLDDLRALVLLAADQIEPGCSLVDQAAGDEAPWPEARLVCAALRADRARLDLGLALQAERGRPVDSLLGSLLKAIGGSARVSLREPPPPDPLLLPLLRRAPLDPQPRSLAMASEAVRRAVAENPNVPAGLAPPAAEPGPLPAYPGLDGRPPAALQAALRAVPAPLRPRWLAAIDGLGAGPADETILDLPAAARLLGGGSLDLAAWRGLEQARGEGARGPILLQLLLLLEGRPRDAAPLALRAAVAALRALGMEAEARAVAAAGLVG